MNRQDPIDIVILWVDGNDPEWQKERNKYTAKNDQDVRACRFRDWDNLQFLFRGIEKFAPWVNNVFLVTCGHYPQWLNLDNPKLKLVKHSDYIPEEFLPTFNSSGIELPLHKLPGLSEKFIYFNDDMFLISSVNGTDFFRDGKPCDMFSERAITASREIEDTQMDHFLLNDMELISRHFERRDVLKKNIWKILNPRYGKTFFYNFISYILPYKKWYGLYSNHLPLGFLKSTFEEVWEQEQDLLTETVSHKFRDRGDVNQYIFKYWTLAKGDFHPYNTDKLGHAYLLDKDLDIICEEILKQKSKLICLNDLCEDDHYEKTKRKLNDCFEKILPSKCSFEKD